MLDNRALQPIDFFHDLTGEALASGYIYYGEPDRDAEAYPITVYWDNALSVAAAQPLRTIAGRIDNSGTPAPIYISGDYSIKVKDSDGVTVYSILSARDMSLVLFVDYDALDAFSGALSDGAIMVDMESGNRYQVVSSGGDVTTSGGISAVYRFKHYDTTKQLLEGFEPSRSTGEIWRYGEFSAEEVTTGETFTNAAGVKLKVLTLASGGVCVQQFGETGTADDNTAFSRFISYLNANATTGYLGQGTVSFSTTQSLTRGGISIAGGLGGSQRTGSTQLQSTLEWVGGASPMFDTDASAHSFQGFGVESNGSATDFLEMDDGSQRVFMTDIYFGHELFSRSVIRSNGNRIGYSKFHRVSATKPAPKFIDLDGQGTGNGCTPVMFTECQFSNTGADFTDPWTVFHIKDETVESVIFDRCLFIGRGGTLVLDSTDTPVSVSIDSLVVTCCEFDNLEGVSGRFFKLENVLNISINDNILTGNGAGNTVAELTACNVTSFRGNYVKSIFWVFDADDSSRIRGVGSNNFDWSGCEGVNDNPNTSFTSLTQAGAISIDGAGFSTEETEQIIVDLTASTGYDFRVDSSRPQNMEPGQRFCITVRNISGGVVAAGAFNSASFKAASPVAPADGFSRTYSFRWNGTHAVETGRTASDIPN